MFPKRYDTFEKDTGYHLDHYPFKCNRILYEIRLPSMDLSKMINDCGVAWWAHIGGFIVGFFMALPALMMTRKKTTYSY